MRTWGRRLLFGIQFLTRYPLKIELQLQPEDFARSSIFFPIIGVLCGAFSILLAWLGNLAQSSLVAAAFAVLGKVWITGAFHIDGLADTADAYAHHNRRRMLHSMKDSRVGLRGTMAIVLDLLAYTVLVFVLMERLEWSVSLRMLAITPACGRLSIVAGGVVSKSARPDGMGRSFIDGMHFGDLLGASIVAGGLLYALTVGDWITMGALYGVSLVTGVAVAKIISIRLKGITGDTFGCINECGELMALITMVVLL